VLKNLEMIENSLRNNSKIVITVLGISQTLLLGSLPFVVTYVVGGTIKFSDKAR
jgi:hypothetical protein